MEYFDAFGGFQPHKDVDAAVKFALNALLLDGRVDELDRLLRNEIGCVEGEPGWNLERQAMEELGERPEDPPWPAGASFRAFVDPESYKLAYPEFYMSRELFEKYVNSGLAAYRRFNAAH